MDALAKLHWRWEDLCGPDGFQPWDDERKDLGLCFQQLCLVAPILFTVAAASGYYVGYRNSWVIRGKLQENAIQLRSLIVLCLAFIPVVNMYVLITRVGHALYPIDYLVGGAECLAWLIHFGYVLALKHRLGLSPRGPVVMLVWWSAAAVLSAVGLRSRALAGAPLAAEVAALVFHMLYFFTLLPAEGQCSPTYYSPCLVGSQYSHFSEYFPLLHQDEGILGTALQSISFTSKLLFYWVEPLFQRGLEKNLKDPDDLFDLPPEYRCSHVGHRIEKALVGNVDRYQQFEERTVQPFMHSGYGATDEGPGTSAPLPTVRVRSPKRHNVSLFRALHTCFGWQFYSIGLLKFISDMAGFAGPLLLNRLIRFVQDPTMDAHMGYLYAGGLLLTTITSAICNSHFNFFMSLVGLKMKAAIISTILRKTLSVTSTELDKSFSVGEITNFMSTDTDRIVNSCPSFHALWSIPLQMFVTLYLLYQQVGISFLAGIAFSVALIPINRCIASKIGQLSASMMRHKDSRVSLASEVLKGIRTIKLHVWEDYFISRISEERRKELKYLKGRKYLDALCVVFWATTPVLVSVLTLSTYVLLGNRLTAAEVFTAVALMNMLIAPLNAFPWVLNGLTEAWVSIQRIQKLLKLTDMNEDHFYDKVDTNNDEENVLIFRNAKFAWAKPAEKQDRPPKSRKNKGKPKKGISVAERKESSSSGEVSTVRKPFSLLNLNLQVRRGQLIGVVGRVGSGKTSLLYAIIAEMMKKDGEIQISDSLTGFGYVSQKPWLQRGTVKDNILFGKPYEETKFRSVVDACGLTDDLLMLGGSGAAVGEGGSTLSGGQRARVALARAVYQDKQVYLLDDILSAVDARVAAHIFRRCVLGLLAHKTRVLVTHSVQFLAQANRVVLMEDGVIKKQGPPDLVLSEMDDFIHSDSESFREESGKYKPIEFEDDPVTEDKSNVSINSFTREEDLTTGSVGCWVIGMYLGSVGTFLSVAILLSLLLMQVSQNFTFLWLSYWVSSENPRNATNISIPLTDGGLLGSILPEDGGVHENTTFIDHGVNALDSAAHYLMRSALSRITEESSLKRDEFADSSTFQLKKNNYALGDPKIGFFLGVYMALAGLNLVFTIMRAFLFAYGGIKAARRIHKSLLKVIMKAKMKFFDVTPAGRILNRFSSDTYTIDDSLPFIFNILLAQVFGLAGALIVTVYGLPWLCLVLVPLVPVYHWLQHRYRLTSRELKRLHSITLSPIYSHFNDTLQGLTTIRAFRASERTMGVAEELVDLSQRAALASAAAAQWLSLRLQCMGVLVISGAAAVAVAQRHFGIADAGLVGLAISYALSVTGLLASVMNAFPETERELVAVERVGEYVRRVEAEPRESCMPSAPLYGWPSQGVVCARRVVVKYREHLAPALKGVSFETRPAEKVGVVGRTGAGKSSLFAALLRLCELHSGAILMRLCDLCREHLAPALKGVSFETRPAEKVGVVGRTGAGKSSLFAALLRLCELHSGAILIDSVDISTLSLTALRTRVAVIPQEPFIFAGTIRENLDPLSRHIESELWLALDRCGARALVEARGGLAGVAAGLSQGHMQLLCLARAILQNAKILCIDEATANVDQETDRLIQEAIRCSFRKSTVITVAHRISTILDSDRVLVMGDGQVLEFDSPDVLLQDPQSHFYALVNSETAA